MTIDAIDEIRQSCTSDTKLKCTFVPVDYLSLESETKLARLELESLLNVSRMAATSDSSVLRASVSPDLIENLSRLTFFKEVIVECGGKTHLVTPNQVLFEKTALLIDRSNSRSLPLDIGRSLKAASLGKRKISTYLMHGIHSYKGKYHPQVVKSILNILNVQPGDVVLDPFTGCGTTNIECMTLGIESIGVDLNPLACLIAKARIESLHIDPSYCRERSGILLDSLRKSRGKMSDSNSLLTTQYPDSRAPIILPPAPIIPNVEKWFEPKVLRDLLLIKKHLAEIDDPSMKQLLTLVFSSIIKESSNWDPSQVRPYLAKKRNLIDPVETFSLGLKRVCNTIALYSFLKSELGIRDTTTTIINEDAKNLSSLTSNTVDFLITSPPYANALPYIETDRLRSIMLDLFTWKDLKRARRTEIGNREILPIERRAMESELESDTGESGLPVDLLQLIQLVHKKNQRLNKKAFRRKNRAALLYKYFTDMNQALSDFARVLRPNGICVMIVGGNRIRAGDDWLQLETDRFVMEMALENHGFEVLRELQKEVVHTSHPRKITGESIIFFRRDS